MGIVGAGPAGLVTAAVLAAAGIDHVVVERQSRAHIEGRARAGLLEHRTVEYLKSQGLAGRLLTEGRRAGWSDFQVLGERMRLDYAETTGGFRHWVYPQHLLIRDLCDELAASGRPPIFSTPVRELTGLDESTARIRCEGLDIDCDYVIGGDGSQGVAHKALAAAGGPVSAALRYPYETLTMLAEVDRPTEGVTYTLAERGFVGMMPRTATISRVHLQIPHGDTPADWSADRIRAELAARLGEFTPGAPRFGALTEQRMLLMRGHIAGSMRHGRLLLAGDAAHLLTPFGGKGANLAVADAALVAEGLIRHYKDGDDHGLDTYSDRRLREVWEVQEFSDRLLRLVLQPDGLTPAERVFLLRMKRATVESLTRPGWQSTAFAHQYVGSGMRCDGPSPHRWGLQS
ncbi:FAD-dependent monooxygenase [Streptomyces sviceus]|uniref:FAD-dependent monooxygenase n=1 Tax=Streptomyces sviceus TaxID=285530 RepID=UPI0036B6FDC8